MVGVYIKITYHNIANIETIDVYIPVAGNLPGVHGVYDLDEGGDGGVERAHGEHEDVRHEGHPGQPPDVGRLFFFTFNNSIVTR